jgi:hypothetical protein
MERKKTTFMKKSLTIFIAFIIILIILPLMPSQCYASSCTFLPDPKIALEKAHNVFSGNVLEIEVYDWRNAVRFQVEKGWKGVDQMIRIIQS